MKSAISWILVVALFGGVYFLYSANTEKSTEIVKLQEQTVELDKLRADNEELKKIPPQNEELARLRKDNAELLRLRSEVQQLRGQNKQLNTDLATAQAYSSQALQAQEKLATENQSLLSQTQKFQATQNAAQEQLNACIYNLRQIDGAKQQWALENKKSLDAVPTATDLTPYLPANLSIVCPAGGTYSINAMNTPPTCSAPGHALPK